MKKFKSVKIECKETISIFCNMCGEEVQKDQHGYYHSFFDTSYRWEYPSKFDNEVHSFQLCEKCYENFISSFKLPPNIENSL